MNINNMDQNQYRQCPPIDADSLAPTNIQNQHQFTSMMPPTYSQSQPSSYPTLSFYLQQEQQFSEYHSLLEAPPPQEQLQQQLNEFWATQQRKIEETTDFKKNDLPLARIKKIMKANEEVNNIAAESCVFFAKACEMFIMELTMRSWDNTKESKRKTLQRSDIAAAIERKDEYDFLTNIVPKDEKDKENHVHHGAAISQTPIGVTTSVPIANVPYSYISPTHQNFAGPSDYTASGAIMGGVNNPNQAHYVQQTHPFVHQMQPPPQPNNSPYPNYPNV